MIYNTFDIVVVPFPFVDKKATKKRPAIVLSSHEQFNKEAKASILAMITSALDNPWPHDVLIQDTQTCGLMVPCCIRMKIFTLDHRLILKKIGKLSLKDQKALQHSLKQLLPR
mgnify:CR=1 FL=1